MMLRRLIAVVWVALALCAPVRADQSSVVMPSTGPMPMSTFVTTYLNPGLQALLSCNSGTTPPANGIGGAAQALQCWWDSSTSPVLSLKYYDGAQWVSTGTLNSSTHAFLPNVATLLAGNNTWTGPNTFNPTSGTAITINPLAGSLNKGIVSTQTGPASGSTAGPIDFNRSTVTFTSAATGSGTTDGAFNAATHAFRWDLTTGGPNLGGPVAAGFFHLHQTVAGTSAGGDKIALTALAYRNVADTGGGGLFGSAFTSHMDTGASGQFMTAQELDVGITSGVVVPWRLGLNITNFGTGQASTLDAAIGITNISSTGSAGGSFLKLIALTNIYGLAPLATTADLFYADAAYTVANGFNLPAMTITGNFVNLPNIGISGAGKAIFGAAIGVLAAGYNLEVTAASSGVAGFGVSTNTTTGSSFISAQDSSGNNALFLAANEAARTGTIFGVTPGNYAQIASSGSTNLGLLFGTAANVPIIIGTNNTARMRVTGAGLVNIGTDVAPLATLTVNKNAAAPAAAITATALFQISSADTVQPVALIDSFGTGNIQPFIVARRGRGTGASFTAVQNADPLGYFGMVGATGANTFASETSAAGMTGGVFFGAVATENWDATHNGAELRLYATPTGTQAIVQAMGLNAGVTIGAPTGTYKGTGTLNMAGAIYANGTIGATCAAGISATTGRSVGGIITAC